MSKRIKAIAIALVMVMSMLATALPSYAADANEVIIRANKTEAHPGDIVEYSVVLGPIDGLQGIQLELDIPQGLTYVEGKMADGLVDRLEGFMGGFNEATGRLIIGSIGSYTCAEETLLLTFSCRVDAGAEGYYTMDLTDCVFPDANVPNGKLNVQVNNSSARVNVTPIPVPATDISLDETELSLVAGTSQQLVATVSPGNSTDKVVWTSSDDKVATVSNDGTVEAVGVGTATITATAGAHSATCAVTVTCAHENVTTKEETDSTCQVQGWDTYKECEDCGQLFDESGKEISEIPFRPLAAHTGGTADCSHKAICEVCGAEYGDFGDHNYGNLVAGVEATCEEEGMSAHYVCSICNTYFDENKTETTKEALTIAALGHDLGDWQSDGTSHWKACSRCPEKLEQGTCTGGEATCTDKAVCEVCGHEYGDLAATNHKHTEVRNAKEPTCKDAGYTGDTYCLDCKELVKAGEVIPATGEHASDEWVSEDGNHWKICDTCGIKFNEGTCTGGEATCVDEAVCEVCGHAYGEVDPDNHKHTEVKDAVEATCTKEGYTGDTYCADCGELIVKGETVVATGVHTPGEAWETDGTYRWQVCEDCGAQLNKELVQDSGTQKPDKEDTDKEETDKESPETGDSAYLMFWVSVMVVAAVTMICVNVYSRKRYNRH